MTRQPWDPGLQIERTALAWIRTCLAFILVALVAFRFTSAHNLPAALALAAVIVPLALLSLWLAWRRYRATAARRRPPGALLPLSATLLTVLTGALSLAYVLLESRSR